MTVRVGAIHLRSTVRCLAVLVLAATASFVSASPAGAALFLTESFAHPVVTDPNWEAGGSGFTSCLTASQATAQTPIPGCPTGQPDLPSGGDADGSGVLRLTDNNVASAGGESTFLLYNNPQPFTSGLVVDFDFFMYDSKGIGPADGISFFLVDGSTNLTQPGAPGGALGYSTDHARPGVNGGFLGIGFDEFGNFGRFFFDGTGCTPSATVLAPNSVTIRGPGNGTTGYCLLATNGSLPGQLHGGTTRAASSRHAHIVVDPSSTASPKVTVSVDFGSGLTQVLQTALPPSPPSTFKFGFGASTGGGTDVHEIGNFVTGSAVPTPQENVPEAPWAPPMIGVGLVAAAALLRRTGVTRRRLVP